MQKPRWFSQPELKKVKITILERKETIHLQCEQCGQVWSPMLQQGGKLPRGYWHCPNRCNTAH